MKVLVIAPHPDDEVIGVGGTVIKRVKDGHDVYVCIVTKGCEPLFSSDSVNRTKAECLQADSFLGVKKTFFLDFPASMIETVPRHQFNAAFIDLIQMIKPDEVYLPHYGDLQKDHQLVSDAAMVALRPKYEHVVKKIYTYETISETGWNIPISSNEFIPVVYEDISKTIDYKLKAMAFYQSQLDHFPATRSLEAIEHLAKFRGAMIGTYAAEAFSLIREIKE